MQVMRCLQTQFKCEGGYNVSAGPAEEKGANRNELRNSREYDFELNCATERLGACSHRKCNCEANPKTAFSSSSKMLGNPAAHSHFIDQMCDIMCYTWINCIHTLLLLTLPGWGTYATTTLA